MRDWLDEGHLAWFVVDVVEAIDTSGFHARHPNAGPGRPAYDPDMMLALLFYAYGLGVRSSRRIEGLCRTDAAFRVICASAVPDHATIARFLVDHAQAIEDVFVDVLRLCGAAGLVSVGTIAIDGTKVGADAALDANRGRAAIQAELERLHAEVQAMLEVARATDAAEDTQQELFGLDRLPTELAIRSSRRARLEAALASIDAAEDAERAAAGERADTARRAAAEGRRLGGRKPKDRHAALARAEAEAHAVQARVDTARAERVARRAAKQAQATAEDRKLRGPAPRDGLRASEQDDLDRAQRDLAEARAAAAEAVDQGRKANLTDPDSRIMKTAGGWVQGYNAQAAVNEHQIVVGCTISQDHNDVGLYQPVLATAQASLAAAGITDTIGVVLADAGYWSDDNATTPGPDRLIATQKDWKQRRAAREMGTTSGPPPEAASPLDAMEHRLRTPQGAQAYARRSHTVEPVFADHKENRGWRTFRRRGLPAVRSEWALMNLSHNIAKLYGHNTSPGHALA